MIFPKLDKGNLCRSSQHSDQGPGLSWCNPHNTMQYIIIQKDLV